MDYEAALSQTGGKRSGGVTARGDSVSAESLTAA